MSIQGSVNQLLGVAGIFGGIYKNLKKGAEKPQEPNNMPQEKPKSPKTKIILNPYIKAEQALKTDGNNKIMQKQMQEKRRKDKGDI